MSRPVRVRFAPSPTGGLHLGGVRTVLYNYLFTRKHGGTFVLRIEDTDQSRYVPGAEEYIMNCLQWCGLMPDESPAAGGPFAPYRQSERKPMYRQYAEQLVAAGHAYYAFDTPEELESMRTRLRSDTNPAPQYDRNTRVHMRNSLTLPAAETQQLIADGTPYVVRINIPQGETVVFQDMIRGEVKFDTSLSDDKVLLKADGMPTYHLAVVVDDHAMQITHAFRGEEWLPSAPVHILLWKYLGWENEMPEWAHLPLILGPDGAKLSKRHGNKYGFPIFAQNWTDPKTGDFTEGFRERGFLPEAFLNLLALLGWNDGSGQEIFSMDELIQRFDLSRVNHSGAAFDFEKAKWYNAQYIQAMDAASLLPLVKPFLPDDAAAYSDEYIQIAIAMIRERCVLLPDFAVQGAFFFTQPEITEWDAIKGKWSGQKAIFFEKLQEDFTEASDWNASVAEHIFNELLALHGLKKGDAMLPLRVMLVGGKFGPGVFDIAALIGKEATTRRIQAALAQL